MPRTASHTCRSWIYSSLRAAPNITFRLMLLKSENIFAHFADNLVMATPNCFGDHRRWWAEEEWSTPFQKALPNRWSLIQIKRPQVNSYAAVFLFLPLFTFCSIKITLISEILSGHMLMLGWAALVVNDSAISVCFWHFFAIWWVLSRHIFQRSNRYPCSWFFAFRLPNMKASADLFLNDDVM